MHCKAHTSHIIPGTLWRSMYPWMPMPRWRSAYTVSKSRTWWSICKWCVTAYVCRRCTQYMHILIYFIIAPQYAFSNSSDWTLSNIIPEYEANTFLDKILVSSKWHDQNPAFTFDPFQQNIDVFEPCVRGQSPIGFHCMLILTKYDACAVRMIMSPLCSISNNFICFPFPNNTQCIYDSANRSNRQRRRVHNELMCYRTHVRLPHVFCTTDARTNHPYDYHLISRSCNRQILYICAHICICLHNTLGYIIQPRRRIVHTRRKLPKSIPQILENLVGATRSHSLSHA